MIKIIVVGKVKTKELNTLINYYKKQIPRKIEIISIKDEPKIDGIEIEGNKILKKIKQHEYVITLEINGEMLGSRELSDKINKLEINGKKDITFIIGGSYGLSKNVSNRANYKLSFSKMTFPHQIMQLLLMEQIFRSYAIIRNHPYHK